MPKFGQILIHINFPIKFQNVGTIIYQMLLIVSTHCKRVTSVTRANHRHNEHHCNEKVSDSSCSHCCTYGKGHRHRSQASEVDEQEVDKELVCF